MPGAGTGGGTQRGVCSAGQAAGTHTAGEAVHTSRHTTLCHTTPHYGMWYAGGACCYKWWSMLWQWPPAVKAQCWNDCVAGLLHVLQLNVRLLIHQLHQGCRGQTGVAVLGASHTHSLGCNTTCRRSCVKAVVRLWCMRTSRLRHHLAWLMRCVVAAAVQPVLACCSATGRGCR